MADLNDNMDTIDGALSTLNSQKADHKVVVTVTLTTTSYGNVPVSAATGYSLSHIKEPMKAVHCEAIGNTNMSALTSDVSVNTANGSATATCTSAPMASVTLEIVLI